MSARHLIVLGTASQAPTRYRAHNSYALRWDDQLILFDPGEGTQRQAILAGVSIARADAVCITHFHGDHCLGLPGVIQRRALDNRTSGDGPGPLGPLPIFFPAEGQDYFDRLRSASIFHDTSNVVAQAIEIPSREGGEFEPSPTAALGPDLTLLAAPLSHRVPTLGYRLQEADGRRLDPDKLSALGIAGPDVGRLVNEGRIETERGTVGLEQVSRPRPGQSMAFIMDTGLCEGAERLADGVDLLVCESTYLQSEATLADRYRHLTAAQAAHLAMSAGARRLVLTHFSARYRQNSVFTDEARTIHPDVIAAEDLATVDVPPRADR